MGLGLLAAASHSQFVQMPTPFNLLWLLGLLSALLLAVPVVIYSLRSHDHLLWLLVSVSVIYASLVLPPLMGYSSPVFSRAVFKILDWVYVALCIGVPLFWLFKKRNYANKE